MCFSERGGGSWPMRDCVWVAALLGLGPQRGAVNQQRPRKHHELVLHLKE